MFAGRYDSYLYEKSQSKQENWDNKGNVFYTDEEGNKVESDTGLSIADKIIRRLRAVGKNTKDFIEESDSESDVYKQKAILASTLIGGFGGLGRSFTTTLSNNLTPYFGRNIGQYSAQGISSGLVGGGLGGFTEGILTDKNPFMTAFASGLSGAAAGGLLGYAGGSINNFNRMRILDELMQKRNVWGIAYRQYSGNPEGAIEKLMNAQQGFVPNAVRRDGGIDFVWGKYIQPETPTQKGGGYGLAHIQGRRNEQGLNGKEFLKNLANLIKFGKKYFKEDHTGRFYIGNENQEAVIRTDYNGKFWNWLNSAYPKDK